MKLAYAVCRHVADGATPDRYETATQGMPGIASCTACFETGKPAAFRMMLWQREQDGFRLVMAGDMRQLEFLQRAR